MSATSIRCPSCFGTKKMLAIGNLVTTDCRRCEGKGRLSEMRIEVLKNEFIEEAEKDFEKLQKVHEPTIEASKPNIEESKHGKKDKWRKKE